jgi:hypothetical protein
MANNKPAHQIRVGSIRAAIWANKNEEGRQWFNVTIARLYRDGEQWKDTSSFRRDDLLVVAKVADLAFNWILAEQAKHGSEEEPEE